MLQTERDNPKLTGIKAVATTAAALTASFALAGCVGMGLTMPKNTSKDTSTSAATVSTVGVYGNPASKIDIPTETIGQKMSYHRVVPYEIIGNGHLRAVDNCFVSDQSSLIRVFNVTEDTKISISKDNPDATVNVFVNDVPAELKNDTLTLPAGISGKVRVEFIEPTPAPEPAPEQPVAVPSTYKKADPGSAQAAPAPAAATAPAPAADPAPAPAADPAPAPAPAGPVVGDGTPMNDEERACAIEIFNAYNDYRASCGLNRVGWSNFAASMAYNSATGCSAINGLQHRLGIPGEFQNSYSDILQYATWRRSGPEAVDKWSTSDGHRRMMKCPSTTEAGVAVFFNGTRYYYVICYNFSGCNQMKNG